MTVQEMIDQLTKIKDKSLQVILSSYSVVTPAEAVELATYTPETTWTGELGIHKLTPELREDGYEECDVEEEEVVMVGGVH